ncbi:Transcription factor TFIIIB component B [Lambiella insularis]|nr:Transcription factor TFIIIB component B [Lambiella insularis]
MASTASSYLSKSKKDFKPKAPIRRPGPAGSGQSSVRATSIISEGGVLDHGVVQATGEPTAVTAPLNSQQNLSVSTPIAGDHESHVTIVSRQSTPIVQASNVENTVTITLPTTRQTVRIASPNPALLNTPTVAAPRLSPEVQITAHSLSTGPVIVETTSDHAPDERTAQPLSKRRKVSPPRKSPVAEQVQRSSTNNAQPLVVTASEQTQTVAPTTADNGTTPTAQKPTKKRQTAKAKGKKRIEERAAAIVADATGGDDEGAEPSGKKNEKRKGSRKRARTPENAEAIRIEPGAVKMAELCRDTRTGKISKRETALQARDEAERLNKEQGTEPLATEGETVATVTTVETSGTADVEDDNSDVDAPGLRALVPTIRIVNGQLVHDEGSRTIDRVALANEARGDNEAVVVVDSLSHKVNSSTYGKRPRKVKWNEVMTDQFYDGLRMFGTDFGMIAKMFPGKTRRTIKLKFTKEEKLDGHRINSTLLAKRKPVDMEEFSKLSNTVYRDPKELERDMAEDRKRMEEEQAQENEAMEEAVRQRAAEAAAEAAVESGGDAGEASAQENQVPSGGARAEKSGKLAKKTGGKPKGRPPKMSAVDKAKADKAKKAAKEAAKVVARALKKKKVGA